MNLSDTAHVVLGLVSIRPSAGHELAAFAERSVGSFFPVTRSHVYRELDRLEQLGLLASHEVPQDSAPTKRVFRTTSAGRAQLESWLGSEESLVERNREPFLVRLFFAEHLPRGRLAELAASYEALVRHRRDTYAGFVEKLADRPGSQLRRATALFGLRREQATLAWLDEVRPLLGGTK